MTCFEIWNNLTIHWYYLRLSIEIYCNTCCQCITIVSAILMDLIRDNIYGFLYIDKNFINFLSYIDSTGIIPMWNDICLVDICTTNSIITEAKYSWFLWQEEGIILVITDVLVYFATIILSMDTELTIDDI